MEKSNTPRIDTCVGWGSYPSPNALYQPLLRQRLTADYWRALRQAWAQRTRRTVGEAAQRRQPVRWG